MKTDRKPAWTRSRIIHILRRRQVTREALNWADVPNQICWMAQYFFGSWANALRAAGIDPESARLSASRCEACKLLFTPRALVEHLQHNHATRACRRCTRIIRRADSDGAQPSPYSFGFCSQKCLRIETYLRESISQIDGEIEAIEAASRTPKDYYRSRHRRSA